MRTALRIPCNRKPHAANCRCPRRPSRPAHVTDPRSASRLPPFFGERALTPLRHSPCRSIALTETRITALLNRTYSLLVAPCPSEVTNSYLVLLATATRATPESELQRTGYLDGAATYVFLPGWRSQRDTWVGCIVSRTTDSRSSPIRSRSTSLRSWSVNSESAPAASYRLR